MLSNRAYVRSGSRYNTINRKRPQGGPMADTTNTHELLVTTFATVDTMAKLLIVKGTYYSAGSYPPRSDFTYLQKILSNSLLQESLTGFGPKQRSLQRCRRRRGIKRQSLTIRVANGQALAAGKLLLVQVRP